MAQAAELLAGNYVNGAWEPSQSGSAADIANPATGESLARIAPAGEAEVARAVTAAARAFPAWRRTPPQDRIQFLFRFRDILLRRIDDLARSITLENGKTLAEAKAEVQRGIENVEVCCGIPTMMQGYNLEDVASGIDEIMIRQPLGVTVAITPFNFPAMIPLWFLPYAVATGNTFILKPSERVPLTARLLFELLHEAGFPEGVVNLVIGAKPAVDALLHHPDVRAISFVGSTPVAKYIYSEGSAHGKRVQCQGARKIRGGDAGCRSGNDFEDRERQRLRLRGTALPCSFSGRSCRRGARQVFRCHRGRASSIRTGNGLENGCTWGR